MTVRSRYNGLRLAPSARRGPAAVSELAGARMPTDEPDLAAHPAALWASAQVTGLLDGRPDPPAYGSPAWAALRANDPRRAAAIITAAEQWRRHIERAAWLDQLLDDDPEEWFRIITADADAYAARIARNIASSLDKAQRAAAYVMPPPRPVRATPGWSPIAIPGRPGWWRHYTDGKQIDLPHRTPGQETAE